MLSEAPAEIFGFTADENGENLPAQYAPWAAFKTLDMHRGEPQKGVDVDACLGDIDAHGFHLTDAHARIAPETAG